MCAIALRSHYFSHIIAVTTEFQMTDTFIYFVCVYLCVHTFELWVDLGCFG